MGVARLVDDEVKICVGNTLRALKIGNQYTLQRSAAGVYTLIMRGWISSPAMEDKLKSDLEKATSKVRGGAPLVLKFDN